MNELKETVSERIEEIKKRYLLTTPTLKEDIEWLLREIDIMHQCYEAAFKDRKEMMLSLWGAKQELKEKDELIAACQKIISDVQYCEKPETWKKLAGLNDENKICTHETLLSKTNRNSNRVYS